MTTEERREQAEVAYEAALEATTELDRKPSRRQVWKIGLAIGALAIAFSLLLSSLAAQSVIELKATQTASERLDQEERDRTRKAIESLQESNRDLQARGQRPVDQPADVNGSDALVAAATARVLANLPAVQLPSADQIGAAVAAYFVNNPVNVSPWMVSTAVSNYFAENPVEPEQGEPGQPGEPGKAGERGEKGEKGDPGVNGHTPTPEEIMEVFNFAAANNPNLLCAGKGTFTEVTGFVRVPPENLPSERSFWVCLPG